MYVDKLYMLSFSFEALWQHLFAKKLVKTELIIFTRYNLVLLKRILALFSIKLITNGCVLSVDTVAKTNTFTVTHLVIKAPSEIARGITTRRIKMQEYDIVYAAFSLLAKRIPWVDNLEGGTNVCIV